MIFEERRRLQILKRSIVRLMQCLECGSVADRTVVPECVEIVERRIGEVWLELCELESV